MLAWLDGDEPSLGRVEQLLADRPLLSWVNAIEVYYRTERDHGRQAADEVLADLRAIMEIEPPGTTRMVQTARLKAAYPIAMADCFAIATATAHDVTLLTGDPEIAEHEGLPCAVEDLRPRR